MAKKMAGSEKSFSSTIQVSEVVWKEFRKALIDLDLTQRAGSDEALADWLHKVGKTEGLPEDLLRTPAEGRMRVKDKTKRAAS